jgi:hypothetical protein
MFHKVALPTAETRKRHRRIRFEDWRIIPRRKTSLRLTATAEP